MLKCKEVLLERFLKLEYNNDSYFTCGNSGLCSRYYIKKGIKLC